MPDDIIRLKKPILIGLTGGPGVGKSEAAKLLAEKGAKIISADSIGHTILRKNKLVRDKVIKLLGKDILDSKNELDRQKIGAIVFNDVEMMIAFNRIIHPVLLKQLKAELSRYGKIKRYKIIAVDAALIFEWGIADWFDIILVITALRDIRLKRICNFGLSAIKAKKRIASQIPQREKISLADYVIENNSNRRQLKIKIDRFMTAIENLL